MKTLVRSILAPLALMFVSFCLPAAAWTCPTGQRWVQVPTGTPGGHVVEGLTFQCQSTTPTPDPSGSTSNAVSSSNATSSSNSTATSSSSASQKQSQSQGQNQTATGGSASASNGDQSNAQNTSYSSNYEEVRQTQTAIATVPFATGPCTKGYGGAAQTGVFGASFGGSKVDEGCDERSLAQSFLAGGSRVAYCKVLVSNKKSRKAGVTLADCLLAERSRVELIPAPQVASTVTPVVVVPAPNVTVNLPQPLEYRTSVDVVAPKVRSCVVNKGTVQARVKQHKPCPVN